jgi:hypothetical protein
MEPKTLNVHNVKGEVVWRQFHGDSSVQAEALFTAGIKFLNLEEASRTIIRETIQSLGAR